MEPRIGHTVCIVFHFVKLAWCWDVLSNMGSRRQETIGQIFNYEYTFGDCQYRHYKRYHYSQKSWKDVQNSGIIREWCQITRLPKCVVLRAASHSGITYRVTRYNFEFCTVRVTFCYDRRRFHYYYYEWFIPQDIVGGIGWDIYLYGPYGSDWLYP